MFLPGVWVSQPSALLGVDQYGVKNSSQIKGVLLLHL